MEISKILVGKTIEEASELTNWEGIFPVVSGGKIVDIADACDMGNYVTDGDTAWEPEFCDSCGKPIYDGKMLCEIETCDCEEIE